MTSQWKWWSLFFGYCFLLYGCAQVNIDRELHTLEELHPSGEEQVSTSDKTKTFEGYAPKLVAILPFENLTSNTDQQEKEEEEEIIRKTFANHFSSRGYQTQWVKVTDSLLQEKGYDTPDEIVKLPLSILGELTQADTIIFGQLTHFDRLFLGIYSQIAVGVRMKMVDVKSGKVLWEEEEISREHSGGFSINPLGMAMTIASNALALRQIELLGIAEDLFREMVTSIPLASLTPVANRPTITLLVNESFNQILKSGEIVRVGITGDPHLTATFDLGESKTNLPMKEIEPGVYLGTYTVSPGDNEENLIVKGKLANERNGEQITWVDALGPVSFDTITPETPAHLFVSTKEHHIKIIWKEGKEPDLANYKVYRSNQPLSGYQAITTTEIPQLLDNQVQDYQTYYYQITSVDKAGNESRPSMRVRGTPVPPGPTRITVSIQADAHWYSGAGPYILESEIEIAQGATLTIEPGTEIQSTGGGLKIFGRLHAEGAPQNWIQFTNSPIAPMGKWAGLTFLQTGNVSSFLQNVRITNALVGLQCEDASPILTDLEILNNDIGVAILYSTSQPKMTNSLIGPNQTHGIVIENNAKPIIENNRITQNKDHGLIIRNAPLAKIHGNIIIENKPLQLSYTGSSSPLDISGNWWGTTEISSILSAVSGNVILKSYRKNDQLEAENIQLSTPSSIGGPLATNTILLQAHSPFLITESVMIDDDATVIIQAGVEIKIKAGEHGIIIRKGALQALGKPSQPVVFTSANTSPHPGDYKSAVLFDGTGSQSSRLKYVKIQYAEVGILVNAGAPEIYQADISNNLQSAINCTGESAPYISYSTISNHQNNAAIVSTSESHPVLFHNNFVNNAWGVINHSPLPLEARENWWGSPNPSQDFFMGNVVYQPQLLSPATQTDFREAN